MRVAATVPIQASALAESPARLAGAHNGPAAHTAAPTATSALQQNLDSAVRKGGRLCSSTVYVDDQSLRFTIVDLPTD